MTSLRLRLLVPLGVGLGALLVAGGVLVYGAVGAALGAGFDATLLEKAQALALHLELRVEPEQRSRMEALGAEAFDGAPVDGVDTSARRELLRLAASAFAVHLADRGRLDPAYAAAEGAAYYEIRMGDGRELARSPSLGDAHLAVDAPPGEKRIHADLVLPDGRPGRAVVLTRVAASFSDEARQRAWREIRGSEPIPALTATVVVAEATEEVDAFLSTLLRALLGLLVLLVVGGAVLAFVLVRRGLAPLDDLRRQIAALDPSALDERIRLEAPPSELAPVVDALNQRLDALEETFERERRTTAHIAHELRTPIAELRTLTEVALQFPDDAALTKQSLAEGHDAALHMSKVVEAVLRLARARASDEASRAERLELHSLVEAIWEGLRGSASARDQSLALDVGTDLVVHADRDAVEALLANLLDNAVRHAPEGSTIRVGNRHANGRVVLTITNPSTDLDEEDLDRLFDLYWRKDAARSASEQGGLGLSLAKAWARAAGVDLALALGDGTFIASLVFGADGPSNG